MQMQAHDIALIGQSTTSRRRSIVIGSVALLHVAAVYALVSGMAAQIAKLVPPDIQIDILKPSQPPKTDPILPKLTHPEPSRLPEAILPTIPIADPVAPTITVIETPPHRVMIGDSGASGVMTTVEVPTSVAMLM